MGTIEKRGKNSWRIGTQVQTENGWEWVRDTIHLPEDLSEAKQRKEAEKALAKLIVDVEAGRTKPAQPKHTVRSFSVVWMEDYVKRNLSENTYKNYRAFLDTRILPDLGDIPLKKLRPLMINEWLNRVRDSKRRTTALPDGKLRRSRTPSDEAKRADPDKQDEPLSPRTVRHYYDTLYAMLEKAVQWEILLRNPMAGVDRPKVPKTKVKYLTEERAVELLRCLRHEENMCYRAALLLALLCGLRLGEVGALRLVYIINEYLANKSKLDARTRKILTPK